MEFKKTLEKDVIPFVEKLMEKEKAHIEFLKEKQSQKPPLRLFAGFDFESAIRNSEMWLVYYTMRRNQYLEYAKKS